MADPCLSQTTIRRSSRLRSAILFTLWLLGIVAASLGWRIHEDLQNRLLARDLQIHEFHTLGWSHVHNRRWKEADAVFSRIEILLPGSTIAHLGHAAADAGRKEEETQFLAYWTGQTLAELEAGRLDQAQAALRRVSEFQPDHPEIVPLRQRINAERTREIIDREMVLIRTLIDARDWQNAVLRAESLQSRHPDRRELSEILHECRSGRQRQQQQIAQASSLFEQARQRDTGEFDQQALDWLREASTLAPDDKAIASLLDKMSSYTRTLRVPEDFPTPGEAIEASRANDRIVIAPGSWQGPLVINHSLELQGSDPATTTLSCPPGQGSALTILGGKSRISCIAFRHDALLIESGERFSAVTHAQGSCDFIHCHFIRSNGHGLAVTRAATATARRCTFKDNAWNGVAAIGKGSSVHIEDGELSENFHNGLECWELARASISRCRITGNSRNGIHIDHASSPVTVTENIISENRQFGMLLTAAEGGAIRQNQVRQNQLGGILVRRKSEAIAVTDNQATHNTGPDLILETGLPALPYVTNTLTPSRSNALHQEARLDD